IEAIDQPCVWLIGLTNRVQPYCRLAIITMQTTQKINWAQRVVSVTKTRSLDGAATVIAKASFLPDWHSPNGVLLRRHCLSVTHRISGIGDIPPILLPIIG